MNAMNAGSSSALIVFGPFLFLIIFIAVGFLVLYFIIRAAINNSRLNQQIDLLRRDIAVLNDRITSLATFAKKSEETGE